MGWIKCVRIQDFKIDNSYNYADIVEAFESGNMCGGVRSFITQGWVR